MKPAVHFFLCLCFLLVGGNGAAFAGNGQVLQATVHVQKGPHLSAQQDLRIVAATGTDEAYSDHISVDEDEEEDTFRKHQALIRYYLPFLYAFFAPHAGASDLPVPESQERMVASTPMYIAQRVIRI